MRRSGKGWDALPRRSLRRVVFFFQAEDGIRDLTVTGVQTCALPISASSRMQRGNGRDDAAGGAEREAEEPARRPHAREDGARDRRLRGNHAPPTRPTADRKSVV